MDAQLVPNMCRRARDRIVDGERGTDRSLSIVAIGDRRPKYRHHTVANVLVDVPAMSDNDAIDALEELLQRSMNLLGVDSLGQFGVAGEVCEQHGYLPALPPPHVA